MTQPDVEVFYRTSGEDSSGKMRPPWFSKQRCLESYLAAVDAAEVEVRTRFFADGPVPWERTARMSEAGTVEQLAGLGNSRSLRQVARAAAASDAPVVALVEDDYLWLPEAVAACVEAAGTAGVDYVTPYDHPDRYRRQRDARTPGPRLTWSAGRTWPAVESTTMTFFARTGILRADLPIVLAACVLATPRDRAMWRALQRLRRRRLVSALPTLATHAELEQLSPGVDWQG